MRIRLLALTALATLAAAAPASATVVNDPDEPTIAAETDIEWAGASRRFVSGTGWLYTHTIKTRAPYTARPCLRLKIPNDRIYRICSTAGGRFTVKLFPDEISYTFTSNVFGNPDRYYWFAETADDRAPDIGYRRYPPALQLDEPELAVSPSWELLPAIDW